MEYKKIVVLMWNPQISSVKESDYAEWFDGLCTFREKFFNWSVWDYEHTGYGDRFILMRVGDDKAGIVMEGLIASDCFEGDDWAGTDRKRYYADLVPMTAYNPAYDAVYPTLEQLQKSIPSFDWSGGHSGRILTDNESAELDKFLKDFKKSTESQSKDISKVRRRDYIIPASYIHPSDEELKLFPNVDSNPFIESLIEQSMGISADRLEKEWKEHEHMWVRNHEDLLRTAAWLAYPLRESLPYYGALCLKLSHQYWGQAENRINAAYAKEAADFLTDPELKNRAIMTWLGRSLRNHQYWGTNYAVDPLICDKVTGLNVLADFLGYDDISDKEEMLHDYYVRNIEINTERDYINVDVCYDSEGDEEDILTFHITDSTEVEINYDTNGLLYIDEAHIGPWESDRVQLCIDGYGIQVRGEHIDIRLKNAHLSHKKDEYSGG